MRSQRSISKTFHNPGFLGAFVVAILQGAYIGVLHKKLYEAEVELRESTGEWSRAMGNCLGDKIHNLCELNGWTPPPEDWPWPDPK